MFRFDRCVLAIAAALLGGCGGSQPPIGAPVAVRQGAVHLTTPLSAKGGESARPLKAHADWLRGGLQKDDLLYLTQSAVKVFTYPEDKLVGGLQQHFSTYGECVDDSGDVFVASETGGRIEEYAHGRIGLVRVLHPVRFAPFTCAVDPTTGDLVATSGFGNRLDIFKDARGEPLVYEFNLLDFMSFCVFDNEGNLFIIGSRGKHALLAELPKGSRKLIEIRLDRPITNSDPIQWDGKYLAVGTSRPSDSKKAVIYRFAITGSRGTLVGTTVLGSPAYDIDQFLIAGKTVVVSNTYVVSSEGKSDVLFYKYPAGGAPTGSLAKAYGTFGMAISRATK